MAYWAPMEEEAELEEGEAAYVDVDDDTDIDPDVALAYIDERIEDVLGHFQKDFEGGVFAQTLGAKYGGYGSFLPVYERCPPDSSHPTAASHPTASPSAQSQSTLTSSCNFPSEGSSQNSMVASEGYVIQTSGAAVANNMHGSRNLKSISGEDPERHNSIQIAEKTPERDAPLVTKPDNPPHQRKLTVRIKVVPDKGLHRNAAIYSGLGLTSPSSSLGNSPEEGRGAESSSQENFDGSTTSILKILTSCPVSRDSLNSPLREDLSNLITSKKESVDRRTASFLKERSGNIVGSDDTLESVVRVKGVLAGEKYKPVRIRESDSQTRLDNQVCSVDKKNPDNEAHNSMLCHPHSHVGTNRSSGSVGKAPEVRQLEQHMPVKKRVLKDKVKERTSACEFVEDETAEVMDVQDTNKHKKSRCNSVESNGKCGLKGFEKECFDQGEDATVQRNKVSSSLSSMRQDKMDNLEARKIKPNKPLKVASQTCDEPVKLTAKSSASKDFPSGGKSKLKYQSNINSTLESDGNLRSEFIAAVKDRKSASRDADKVHHSHNDSLVRKLERMDGQENPPEKHLFHASGTDNVPPSDGLMSTTEPTPGSSSVVITEDWVECVRCETWRLLPPGISAGQLPDTWTCSMQNWLPGMNRCGISEDETTQTLRTLYHAPVPETQNNLLTGADANATQAQLNVVRPHQMNLGKKFQSKDTSHSSNTDEVLLNSHLMTNHQQDVMKSKPFSEANIVRKSNEKLSKKSGKVIEKRSDSLEDNDHEKARKKITRVRDSDNYHQGVSIKVKTEGPSNINKLYSSENDHEKTNKKLKRESNTDCDDQEVAKRVKIEGPMDMGNLYSSEGIGKPGKTQASQSVKKAALKEKQKQLGKKEKAKLQISVKRPRDSLPDSVDSSLSNVKTHEATRLFTKMEKLEKSGDQFRDTEIPVKENSSDIKFKTGKKLKALESGVRGFRETGAADKFTIGNTQTRILGSRTNIVEKTTKKGQRLKEKLASGLTMEDIEALKRDLGSEEISTFAPSSSSKVSDSRRNRPNYQEVKGSPVESVSSSPMRLSSLRMCGLGKDDSKFGKFPAERTRKRLSYIDDAFESNQSGTFMEEPVGNLSFDTKGKYTTSLPVHADSDTPTSKRSSSSHVHVQGINHHTSKIRIRNNPGPSQGYSSGVDTSARFKEINEDGSDFKGVVDGVPILSDGQYSLQRKKRSHNFVENSDNPFSDQSTVRASTNDDNVSKRNSGTEMELEQFGDIKCQSQSKPRECDLTEGRTDALRSDLLRTGRPAPLIQDSNLETGGEMIPTDMGVRSVKLKGCSNNDYKNGLPFQGTKSAGKSKRGGPLDIRPLNTLKGGEESHILESVPSSVLGNSNHGSINHPGLDQCGDQNLNGPNHSKEDTTVEGASAALAKAEEYRHFGDFSKESGFECNEAYFKAALMYLLAAALLESCNSECQKGEMNQIQIFDSSAMLCKTCALEFEKRQEMAAAALAYKCMEVSYMRIVYLKSSCSRRVWNDLQASLQMIPQTESPSSSASDIDNPNCQIINDKAVFCKGNGSADGNHIITPRDHQNFTRLLDFTNDVNSAMEAARKSQNTFASAAKMISEQSQQNNIITTVKEVIDFGFQDLEAFVQMVQHAIDAIARLGFGGG